MWSVQYASPSALVPHTVMRSPRNSNTSTLSKPWRSDEMVMGSPFSRCASSNRSAAAASPSAGESSTFNVRRSTFDSCCHAYASSIDTMRVANVTSLTSTSRPLSAPSKFDARQTSSTPEMRTASSFVILSSKKRTASARAAPAPSRRGSTRRPRITGIAIGR